MKNSLLFLVFLLALSLTFKVSEARTVQVFSSLEEVLAPGCRDLVLLVFFSIQCYVCFEDLFEMKGFIEENRLPVQIVGVSQDAKKELESFLKKYSFFYPVVCDTKKVLFRKFKVDLEPFQVLIQDNQVLCQDDYYREFVVRRERMKRCLLSLTSK